LLPSGFVSILSAFFSSRFIFFLSHSVSLYFVLRILSFFLLIFAILSSFLFCLRYLSIFIAADPDIAFGSFADNRTICFVFCFRSRTVSFAKAAAMLQSLLSQFIPILKCSFRK
jgi:hypothetical protein